MPSQALWPNDRLSPPAASFALTVLVRLRPQTAFSFSAAMPCRPAPAERPACPASFCSIAATETLDDILFCFLLPRAASGYCCTQRRLPLVVLLIIYLYITKIKWLEEKRCEDSAGDDTGPGQLQSRFDMICIY